MVVRRDRSESSPDRYLSTLGASPSSAVAANDPAPSSSTSHPDLPLIVVALNKSSQRLTSLLPFYILRQPSQQAIPKPTPFPLTTAVRSIAHSSSLGTVDGTPPCSKTRADYPAATDHVCPSERSLQEGRCRLQEAYLQAQQRRSSRALRSVCTREPSTTTRTN